MKYEVRARGYVTFTLHAENFEEVDKKVQQLTSGRAFFRMEHEEIRDGQVSDFKAINISPA